MTTISSTASSSYYASLYSKHANSLVKSVEGSNATAGSESATNVTLSAAAKAMAAEDETEKDFATIIAEARAALTKLLADAKTGSPYEDGKTIIDLASLDRRSVFAIASNGEDKFTADEQKLAKTELQRRFDSAMAGPTGVLRVTGDFNALYKSAVEYYESMSPEEKATSTWKAERAALETGLAETAADKTRVRRDIPDDPVAAYLVRVTEGTAGQLRDFADVARDARAALDAQIAAARAAGTELVFSSHNRKGQLVDFTNFDSRTLSAIALNEGDTFSEAEVKAAKAEVKKRSGANILAGMQYGNDSGDITMFSQMIISQYSAMSPEERQAAGWSEDLYQSAIANYKSSSTLSSLLAQLSGNQPTLLDALGGTNSSNNSLLGSGDAMSLLGYL